MITTALLALALILSGAVAYCLVACVTGGNATEADE
jgi:hypothetical protein